MNAKVVYCKFAKIVSLSNNLDPTDRLLIGPNLWSFGSFRIFPDFPTLSTVADRQPSSTTPTMIAIIAVSR